MDEHSRSIARLLAVLEQLGSAPQPLTNQLLARRLKVPVSSMFRLLQKLVELGYVHFDPDGASYAIAAPLGDLGERLADAGCRSLPMRRLLASLRERIGYNISVWVPSGLHVRVAAVLPGRQTARGEITVPGEIRPPFSTPGLAIALSCTDAEVRALARHCRRRGLDLGRRFTTTAEVLEALRTFRKRGHVPGYNIIADGWALIAWPIPMPVALDPHRMGALSIGSQVPAMRRDEGRLQQIAAPLLAAYRDAVQKAGQIPRLGSGR
jgi:IclR family pca regulon transcriptional regulator